jgi:hypothetical protein
MPFAFANPVVFAVLVTPAAVPSLNGNLTPLPVSIRVINRVAPIKELCRAVASNALEAYAAVILTRSPTLNAAGCAGAGVGEGVGVGFEAGAGLAAIVRTLTASTHA